MIDKLILMRLLQYSFSSCTMETTIPKKKETIMIEKQNLHTHSLFCDGEDSLEDMVKEAINQGFTSIGFSSHAYTAFPFDECGIKSKEKERLYLETLSYLKEKYRGIIRIYKGIEMESRDAFSLSPLPSPLLDYSIGSVHYFWKEDKSWSIDYTPKYFLEAKEAFGSFKNLVESYWEEVIRFMNVSDYQILGHIDLVTKFAEKEKWDFELSPWYKEGAEAVVDEAKKRGKIIEVNTGAMARGNKSTPYPSSFILDMIKDKKVPITVTTDCHNKSYLSYGMDEAKEMLRTKGFKEYMILTDDGFRPFPL